MNLTEYISEKQTALAVYNNRIYKVEHKYGSLKCFTDYFKKEKEYHGFYGLEEYKIWESMRGRCRNPKFPKYKNYGGRGYESSIRIFNKRSWYKRRSSLDCRFQRFRTNYEGN